VLHPLKSKGCPKGSRAQAEAYRLELEASLYDPLTRELLIEAGVREGMRVLDVGSGRGAVALLASDLVGPTGCVVGLACSETMVRMAAENVSDAGKTNVRFVRADAGTARLRGRFDALVGRFILRELDDAVEALRRLSRLLVPGGIVAFHEKVLAIPVTSFPCLPLLEDVRSWMEQARRHAGVEIAMGARLPQLYTSAGLPSPSLRLDAPVGAGPDWKGYGYLAETLRGMMPLMPLYEIAREDQIGIDDLETRMREEALSRAALVVLTPCIGAWTRVRDAAPRSRI